MSGKIGKKKQGESKRQRGAEFRAAGWLMRHPAFTAVPAAATTGVVELGSVPTAATAASAAVAGLVWWRADPDTFDRYAAPVLRAARRRWLSYVGRRWDDILDSCGLVRENAKKGIREVPRLVRVRSTTPTIDVLTVRMVRGQSIRKYEAVGEELAQSLDAESMGIIRVSRKPKLLKLVVVRRPPFESTVDAAEIPDHAEDVDLSAVPVGEDEYGNDATLPLLGNQVLGGGASGSGKGGLIWNPLRSMGPAIRERYVIVTGIDGKGGVEMEPARPVFAGGLATQPDEFLPTLRHQVEKLRYRKQAMAAANQRKVTISQDMPYELLIIDELAMLTAYGSRDQAREINQLLGEILTQGRALGFSVAAFVQDPSKDVVALRDLFTYRVALRTATAAQVDMLLGEDMRSKGALADLIDPDDDSAGVGFIRQEKASKPSRIRLGFVTDADQRELVAECSPAPLSVESADVASIHQARSQHEQVGPDRERIELDLDGDGLDFDEDLDAMPVPAEPSYGEFQGNSSTEEVPAITGTVAAELDTQHGRAAAPDDLNPPF